MIPLVRLALLGGCVIVTALVSPTSARVLTEDLLGSHALQPASDIASDTARVEAIEWAAFAEASEEDGRIPADPEAGHDAP